MKSKVNFTPKGGGEELWVLDGEVLKPVDGRDVEVDTIVITSVVDGDIDMDGNSITELRSLLHKQEHELTWAAEVTTALSSSGNSQYQRLTLEGDTTLILGNPGTKTGFFQIRVIQDGTGGHSLTVNPTGGHTINYPKNSSDTPAQGAGEESILLLYWNGSKWFARYEKDYVTSPLGPAKNSIEEDGEQLQLAGDEDAPGNSQYYGTDEAGAKGFHELPEAEVDDPGNVLGGDGSPDDDTVAIGLGSETSTTAGTGTRNIAIGVNAKINTGSTPNSVAAILIGGSSSTSTRLGNRCRFGICIGDSASIGSDTEGSIAIGYQASVLGGHTNAMVLGRSAVSAGSNVMVFGVTDGGFGPYKYLFRGSEIKMPAMPTEDPSEAGALWNDSGTVKISAGA